MKFVSAKKQKDGQHGKEVVEEAPVPAKTEKKMKKGIPEIVSGLLVLLFAYTAMSKLFGFAQFRAQLGISPWLDPYAGWVAWLVPVAELLIAVMLTVKATRLYGLYTSLALLSVFTVYIGGMLLTQQHLPCSCGGVIEKLSWKQHLVFNVFFMALCSWGIAAEQKTNKVVTKLQIE